MQQRLSNFLPKLASCQMRTGQLRADGARATPGDRVLTGQVIREAI